jgi:hypothetical protein
VEKSRSPFASFRAGFRVAQGRLFDFALFGRFPPHHAKIGRAGDPSFAQDDIVVGGQALAALHLVQDDNEKQMQILRLRASRCAQDDIGVGGVGLPASGDLLAFLIESLYFACNAKGW